MQQDIGFFPFRGVGIQESSEQQQEGDFPSDWHGLWMVIHGERQSSASSETGPPLADAIGKGGIFPGLSGGFVDRRLVHEILE
jgi:hypothetical protein